MFDIHVPSIKRQTGKKSKSNNFKKNLSVIMFTMAADHWRSGAGAGSGGPGGTMEVNEHHHDQNFHQH